MCTLQERPMIKSDWEGTGRPRITMMVAILSQGRRVSFRGLRAAGPPQMGRSEGGPDILFDGRLDELPHQHHRDECKRHDVEAEANANRPGREADHALIHGVFHAINKLTNIAIRVIGVITAQQALMTMDGE